MKNKLVKNGKSIWDQEIILDGGMGAFLTSVEVDSSPIWSGIANINSRDVVIDAHQKFINAGADAIISNTFFVNHTNLQTELHMTEEQASKTILGVNLPVLILCFGQKIISNIIFRYSEYCKRGRW